METMRITKKVRERIEAVNGVIAQYGEVTIRQIYYRLVGVLGVNYRQVIYACKVGRQQGLISYSGIVDRARPVYDVGRTFETAEEFIDEITGYFRLNYWIDSDNEVEIWTEKDALSQILFNISKEYQVTVRVTRGFLSLSNKARWGGSDKTILYFGDHDPSGLFIDKDLEWSVAFKNFRRIALTREQTDKYNLPSVPVNRKDPRAPAYLRTYGNEGWEIDALPPDVLQNLVRDTVEEYVDFNIEEKRREEREIVDGLERLVERTRE